MTFVSIFYISACIVVLAEVELHKKHSRQAVLCICIYYMRYKKERNEREKQEREGEKSRKMNARNACCCLFSSRAKNGPLTIVSGYGRTDIRKIR